MKNFIKILILGILLFSLNQTFAMDFGLNKVDARLQGGQGDFIEVAMNIISYLVGLIYIIAIVLGIYAGFQILTSGGDDGKVKKGKQTLIYVIVGLAVLLLSSVIINWTIKTLSDEDIVGPSTTQNP